jgi:hypothetical protein
MLPAATVFDAAGNLYFVETGNHAVRRFSTAGVITTVAGTGIEGFAGDGGLATAAELDSPAGLALDSAGNLYIADTHNHRIREVSAATGLISTIAGTGVAGYSGDGGLATVAELALPTALGIDATGNLYIADTNNHRVRKIATGNGVITTVAGNGIEAFAGDGGVATAASIDSPNGLALDSAGDLYIADTHNGRVRIVNAATGLISTVAGAGVTGGNVQSFGGDGATANSAGLALPRGLTLDSAGNLYIADSANHRIRKVAASGGVISTVAGQGTENFAGDSAPAVAANLDTPRSVAISPGGLLTLADTHNQRIRQLDALPAPGPDIHTIAGLGASSSWTMLSLTGSSVVAYGSGSLTATLTAATTASGSITYIDTTGGTQTTLGTSALNSDVATYSTSSLAAGAHSIVATYAGDATHTAAQSSALAMTVTPLTVTATPNAASILYGQALPTFSGTLTGVLAQDAGKVAASYISTAAALSPVGLYPITATALTGTAAGNYTLANNTAGVNLSITQAPTQTGLATSTSSSNVGVPVTLTVAATSTTSAVPTGSVTLLDGSTVLTTLPLTAGAATFTTSLLALGSHNLSASYSGDTNFLPSSSATELVAVAADADFSLAATSATSQSILQGGTATYSFSVGLMGAAISSPITLAVSGLPTGATASFNPSYIPPGGAVTSFTVTIQTPQSATNQRAWPDSTGSGLRPILAILLLPAIGLARRSRRIRRCGALAFAVASCILFTTLATGCAARVNTASESVDAPIYLLTVTGTATGSTGNTLQHFAVVTLQVIP